LSWLALNISAIIFLDPLGRLFFQPFFLLKCFPTLPANFLGWCLSFPSGLPTVFLPIGLRFFLVGFHVGVHFLHVYIYKTTHILYMLVVMDMILSGTFELKAI
jgi:hypothetical protein